MPRAGRRRRCSAPGSRERRNRSRSARSKKGRGRSHSPWLWLPRQVSVESLHRRRNSLMKRTSMILLLVLSVVGLAAQAPEKVDADAIAKIREQGLKQSKVMDHLFQMTDVHGPRLTGSPGFEAAGDWAVATLKSWGLQNARKERWPYGNGWSLS